MYRALCSTLRAAHVHLSRVRALLTSLGVLGAAGGDDIFLDSIARIRAARVLSGGNK